MWVTPGLWANHPIPSVYSIWHVPALARKPWILSFPFPGLGNAWNLLKKWVKPGILTQNLEKKPLKFVNFILADSHFKMSFTKKSHLHLCHIYIINTNNDSKPNWCGILLLLPGKYIEFHVAREMETVQYHTHAQQVILFFIAGQWTKLI